MNLPDTRPFAQEANYKQYGTPYERRRVMGWRWLAALFCTTFLVIFFI